jgi:hypothetical protein
MKALCLTALALGLCQCGSEGFFDVISPAAPGSVFASCGASTAGPVSAIEVGASTALPLDDAGAFAPLADGTALTPPIFLPGEYASGFVTVRVALGGVTLSRRLRVVR